MAGTSEFRSELFINHYHHIRRLQLLSEDELTKLKNKRNFFEISIKNAAEIKPFIDYIKYEIALMKKFKHMDFENEEDSRTIDFAITKHVKNLFRLALKRFQDKRKLWEHYINFAKLKHPNSVSRIYEEMLRFHNKAEDYVEAAEHEVTRKNFDVAMNILMQGMGRHQESCELLVAFYIECSINQGEELDETGKEATIIQASKFYSKFLKNSRDIKLQCELLKKIQNFEYSMSFQNDVLKNLMENSSNQAELWNLLAVRHLDGFVYRDNDDTEEKLQEKVSFEDGLKYAIEVFEKSLDSVEDKQKMFSFYIDKLLELDDRKNMSISNLKTVRKALGKAMSRGFEEEKLSDEHFVSFLKLRMLDIEKNREKIEEMLENGQRTHPNSMEFCELAIRYYLTTENHEKINEIFKNSVEKNEKLAVELYKFLCVVYLSKTENQGKARAAMLEAVNSKNQKLSEAFQPYYVEYHALTDGIQKAREVFNQLIATRTTKSLSVDFLKMMIKLEQDQNNPDDKMILNCYERATDNFGKENYEIWLDYIKFLWKSGKHTQADELKKRAMENLKYDLNLVGEFELKFTMLRNESGMET